MTHSQFLYIQNLSNIKTEIFITKTFKQDVWFFFFLGMYEQWDLMQVTGRIRDEPPWRAMFANSESEALVQQICHGIQPYAWNFKV